MTNTMRPSDKKLTCCCVKAGMLLAVAMAGFVHAAAQGKPAADGAKKETQPAVIPSAADHQKAMQADLGRLLQLARQLKVEVDHTRQDELSIKVIRDADEIDKLARSARGRIR
ncbi:MAG: hypothetical protein ACRYGF_13155 [Janthinobacterium lividum]